jgi:predicted dehydrogenase
MKELGGGALMDVGCYCVNLARLLVGAEPVAASASAVWAPGGVDQSLAGTLEFPGGVLAAIDCSFETGVSMHQGLDISGTQGRIRLAEPFRVGEEPVAILLDRMGRSETVQAPGAYEYHLMLEHFADAVLHDRPLDYPPQDSLGNIRTMAALYESARTGVRVAVSG